MLVKPPICTYICFGWFICNTYSVFIVAAQGLVSIHWASRVDTLSTILITVRTQYTHI